MSELVAKLREAVATTKPIYLDIVYRVDETTVAKVFNFDYYAETEFRIGRRLFNEGLQVPEFYDMAEIEPVRAPINCLKEWVVFMQHIKGNHIPQISWWSNRKSRREAVRQYKEQVKNVLDLGIHPQDAEWHQNSLFNEEEQKLYLIDFAFWDENPDYSKLDAWREAISWPSITLEVSVNKYKVFWG